MLRLKSLGLKGPLNIQQMKKTNQQTNKKMTHVKPHGEISVHGEKKLREDRKDGHIKKDRHQLSSYFSQAIACRRGHRYAFKVLRGSEIQLRFLYSSNIIFKVRADKNIS